MQFCGQFLASHEPLRSYSNSTDKRSFARFLNVTRPKFNTCKLCLKFLTCAEQIYDRMIELISDFDVLRVASFSDEQVGGNPAGVVIAEDLPDSSLMQSIAAEVGYSETVFAAPIENGWRVRYFSPESEVPFCGHATIALGAALAMRSGDGVFELTLNNTKITVEGHHKEGLLTASLQSPLTRSKQAPSALLADVLNLFSYSASDVNEAAPPAIIHGGADHFLLMLNSREALAAMSYDLNMGRELMRQQGWATIMLVYAESPQLFHSRNAFASGGVYEDPATGAATAAFAGYLRDIDWPHKGVINIIQGEDMGMRSLIRAEIPPTLGSSIRVSGAVRPIV